jgi:hypothetical protein
MFMETNVPRTKELPKTELEFYLRLFEKAERDLKKKSQSAPDSSSSGKNACTSSYGALDIPDLPD